MILNAFLNVYRGLVGWFLEIMTKLLRRMMGMPYLTFSKKLSFSMTHYDILIIMFSKCMI
mgnify:CR=1 FL=1